MKLEFNNDELRPLVDAVVSEVIARVERAEFSGKLAFQEAEAAAALDLPKHQLRDRRRRGELTGSKVGKQVVYAIEELRAFITRQRIT